MIVQYFYFQILNYDSTQTIHILNRISKLLIRNLFVFFTHFILLFYFNIY